jgi:hypothetical protein
VAAYTPNSISSVYCAEDPAEPATLPAVADMADTAAAAVVVRLYLPDSAVGTYCTPESDHNPDATLTAELALHGIPTRPPHQRSVSETSDSTVSR